jgi:type I restriction enzyme, S subunit
MMPAWPTVRLAEVLRQRKEFIEIDDLTTYKRPRVQLHAQGIVPRDELPGALIKTKRQQMCRSGEFLVAEIDAKVGGFGVVSPLLDGSIVSSHYFLFVVDETKLDRRFLDYFIRTHMFRTQVEAQGSTNYAAIRPADVLGYTMPLPPLAEQRRVVARIEELAGQIDRARALRRQAQQQASALWARSTGDVFARLETCHPPKLLRDLVSVRGGGTPSKADPVYWDGDIPWITPKDVKSRELSDARQHISQRATEETAARLLEPGAVLVVVRGMILANTFPSAVLRRPAAINQDMKALVPQAHLLPEFLCSMLWAQNARFLQLVEKSTHDTRRLDTDKLLDAQMPVPPIPEQRRVVTELEGLEARMVTLKRLQSGTAAELNALLPATLDRAFKGELV